MPLLILAAAVLVLLAVITVTLPLSLIQRYRIGTARRTARGWVATLNLVTLSLSAAMFLSGAAVTSVWVPGAFTYSAGGFAVGCLLGIFGLATTRWEPAPRSLHYTPNRWLVLAITLVVTGRLLYGFWRAWQAADRAADGASWIVAAGLPGSMAAGALVLGYYLVFWAGVRRRYRRQHTIVMLGRG